jgi:hypothetical protein
MHSADSTRLSRQEAADLAGVSIVTLDRFLRQPGGPPWEKSCRRVRIPREAFVAWLASQVKGGGQ